VIGENLISLLHSDPSSSSRSCLINNGDISVCDQPCSLSFVDPNDTFRICENQQSLTFQTTVGRSTPTNKPEYNYRMYAYACTTELCNGVAKQQEIEKLLQPDNGECLIDLDDGNKTTTSGVTPTFLPTAHHNQAISFSKSFIFLIISFFMMFFYCETFSFC
jgi:hypothetical protein